MEGFDSCRFDFRLDKNLNRTNKQHSKSVASRKLGPIPRFVAEARASPPTCKTVLLDVATDEQQADTAKMHFKCKLCRKSFASEEFLVEHQLKQHEVNVSRTQDVTRTIVHKRM